VRLYNEVCLALCLAGCGSDPVPLPDADRGISSLDEAELERLCDEFERHTSRNPEYTRGPCVQVAAEAAVDSSQSCEALTRLCMAKYPGVARMVAPCPLQRESLETECARTFVGDVLTCMPALAALIEAYYADTTCRNPGVDASEARKESLTELHLAPCQRLAETCPSWFDSAMSGVF
jgi:hypothetical protein